ncbi:mannitol 1-phosphate dehydrogenase [Tothia fuscella]|uniref:Mannitol 1-phosphate dehydrogenase n=1 Tax=Tothia fuscella TaxID=1048955 RepID=A0A9P4NVN2_9PEZI|nr:mannitol 1-phosphate dehydrogenase [Tothia fuscella]
MTAPPPKKPLNIAIVGGGLAGIALTIGLLRHGITPHVYEAASNFGEIGAGIAFGPNSVRAINLLSPEALAALRKLSTSNQDPAEANTYLTMRYGTDSRNGDGKKCGDLILRLKPSKVVQDVSEIPGMNAMSTVHRARLLDSWAKLVPEGITSFGKRLTEVEILREGGVRLYFADGTTADADAVIGCDGIRSQVRNSIFKTMGKNLGPKYVGEYAYRSLISSDVAKEILGSELAMNGNLWWGYGGYIINYPVEQGRLVNVVAVVGGEKMEWDHSEVIRTVDREKMYNDFKEWDPRLQRLLREFKTADQWSLWDLIHDEPYNHGRVCLMGDAAHASTPHLGAGAGFAMEDAFVLSGLLATATSSTDLDKVFEAFTTLRRERTQKLVVRSREASKDYAFCGKGIEDDADKLVESAKERFLWIWEIDLEEHLEEGKKRLLRGQ